MGAPEQGRPGKPYATATYDALRILGPDAETPPEAPGLPEPWGEALYYYHVFVRAKCAPAAGPSDELRRRQARDGSFRNPNGLMKEDDPLVATGLALAALCLAR